MQEVEVSGREVYRSFKETIKIDNSYCFGTIDGKNFTIARTTQADNITYIRWCKGKTPYSTNKNIMGQKAEKLLKMVLERIPNIPENETLIEEMQTMLQKNIRATAYFGVSQADMHSMSENQKQEDQKKKDREFQKFIEDKARYADKNAARKAEKEAKKEAQKAAKEAEKQRRQEEAQKRIQAQRALKLFKNESELYPKMVFNDPENEKPAIFIDGKTAIILGHLNKNLYRIKISPNNPSFFIIQNNEKVRKMSIAELQEILISIHEKYNQKGEYDSVLERSVSDYDKFRQHRFPENKNVLAEKTTICKNILIIKGLINEQNVLS